jgi:hypothetical protein
VIVLGKVKDRLVKRLLDFLEHRANRLHIVAADACTYLGNAGNPLIIVAVDLVHLKKIGLLRSTATCDGQLDNSSATRSSPLQDSVCKHFTSRAFGEKFALLRGVAQARVNTPNACGYLLQNRISRLRTLVFRAGRELFRSGSARAADWSESGSRRPDRRRTRTHPTERKPH